MILKFYSALLHCNAYPNSWVVSFVKTKAVNSDIKQIFPPETLARISSIFYIDTWRSRFYIRRCFKNSKECVVKAKNKGVNSSQPGM